MSHKIFVSIACWRDPFILNTVESIFKNAMFPERVNVGIVFQGYPEDDSMLNGVRDIMPDNIKVKMLSPNDSYYMCQVRGEIMGSLMQDEDFFFQIDSHTKLAWAWDVHLIAELKTIHEFDSNGYVQGFPNVFAKWEDPIVQTSLTCVPDEQIFIEQGSALQGRVKVKDPLLITAEKFFSANFVFAPMRFVKEVPQPSEISFDWEQPIMAMRVWTAGWTGYSPTKSYISVFGYNNFSPEELQDHVRHIRSIEITQKAGWMRAEADSRIKFIDVITGNDSNPAYGPLGVRSLDSYLSRLGFDPITLLVSDYGDGESVNVNEWQLLQYECEEIVELNRIYRQVSDPVKES